MVWKGFTIALKFIKSNISWTIRNGEKITVWDCNWILCREGICKPLFSIIHPNVSVKELWNLNKCWDKNKVRSYFSDNREVNESLKIYIPLVDGEDKKKLAIHQRSSTVY